MLFNIKVSLKIKTIYDIVVTEVRYSEMAA